MNGPMLLLIVERAERDLLTALLTLSAALSGRMVEGETQGDQGSNLQDDEGDILQGLPNQLQEGFWLLWRYQVFPKYFSSLVQVGLDTSKTWERTKNSVKMVPESLHISHEWPILLSFLNFIKYCFLACVLFLSFSLTNHL